MATSDDPLEQKQWETKPRARLPFP